MKTFKIICGKHGRPSTKELYKGVRKQNSEHLIKSSVFKGFVKRSNPNNLNVKEKLKNVDQPDCRNSIVIRWGWYGNILTDNTSIVYNKAEAIKAANDKGQCRITLAEKGVPVPTTALTAQIRANKSLLGFPVIARPSHHGRGKHLWVCNNVADIDRAISKGAAYFSKIYPKTEEYRVHVGLGKVLAVMRKPAPADPSQVAWNRAQNDQPFEYVPWSEWKNYICKAALRACAALELDIAGVDIMVQKTDSNLPKAVVCEVNTAPTLNSSPYVLERYTKLFNKIANSQERIQHWNFEQFEKAESLAWKNEQLE